MYSPISLTLPVASRDKAKSLLLKGRLFDCYKPGLSSLFIIIHQVTHGNMCHAMRKPTYDHRSTGRVKEIKQYTKKLYALK